MLIHPTVDRLRALGLAAMADTFVELQNNPEAAEMPHADWLGILVDREVTARDNRRLTRRLTRAKLRQAATIENVDYRTALGVRKLRGLHGRRSSSRVDLRSANSSKKWSSLPASDHHVGELFKALDNERAKTLRFSGVFIIVA